MWSDLEKVIGWGSIAEITILALLIFGVLTFLRGTRGEGMVKTLAVFLAFSYLILRTAALGWDLKRLALVLDAIFQASVIALVVIFQPELRRGLAMKIGPKLFKEGGDEEQICDEVVSAALRLAKTKIGALIVLERQDNLKEYITTGTLIDSEVRADLMRTLFYPGTPLHDGAAIIQDGRVKAAGCFLPLTDNPAVPKALGTRHRAGIGLSEVEDAIVVIVSEETGGISLAEGGVLHRDLDKEGLQDLLRRLYLAGDAPTDSPGGGEGKEPKDQTARKPRDKTTSRAQRRPVAQ